MSITRRDLFHRTPLALSVSALVLADNLGLTVAASAQAQTPPAPGLMDPGPLPDRVLGSPTASVTIVEYASMTCSHCAEFAITTFRDVKSEFIDTGKVRYIAREFPLDDLSAVASMLIRSVGEDRYYEAMDTLFRQQRQWWSTRIQPLMTIAVTELGFTDQSFEACITDQQLLDRVKQARDRASALGITSTPTFFINGDKVASGYMTTRQMEDQIASYLKA